MALSPASPRWPTPDETLAGLAALSRDSEASLVPFEVGEDPAWLVNHPDLVHDISSRSEDLFAPAHPYAAAPALYTPSGLFMLGLAGKGEAGREHASRLARTAVERSEALAKAWLAAGPELEIGRGLRELSASWAAEALYGVAMDDAVPELVAATLAFEDEAYEDAAGPEGARARLAAFCRDLLDRQGRSGEAEQRAGEAATILPTLLNASVALALALSWAIYLLGEHPGALAWVEAELGPQGPVTGALPPASALPRCRAVVLESLRLYPPTWLLMREVGRAFELDGHALEPGSLVALSPWTLHRHPRWWPAPDRFDPARFDGRGPPERGAWLPFGQGAKRCVGAHVALPMMVTVLAALLRRVRPRPASGPPPALAARVSLRSRAGIRVGLDARA